MTCRINTAHAVNPAWVRQVRCRLDKTSIWGMLAQIVCALGVHLPCAQICIQTPITAIHMSSR